MRESTQRKSSESGMRECIRRESMYKARSYFKIIIIRIAVSLDMFGTNMLSSVIALNL